MGKLICIILYVLVLASSLQLLLTASSSPLPAADNNNNGESSPANDSAANNCRCNGTKLTVKGNFLSKWLNPSNSESRITIVSMAANYLKMFTDNKGVRQFTIC